jgi:ribosomal protein S10
MEKVSIRIKIQSFEQPAIEAAIEKLNQLLKLHQSLHLNKGNSQEKFSYTALPPTVNRFTVLRSPHIDKKSREQFQQKGIAANVSLPPMAKNIAPLVLTLLRNSELVGVELRVTVVIPTGLYQ